MHNDELLKLIDHMFWADTEVWKTVISNDKASGDASVKKILLHYLVTQHAFYTVWADQKFVLPKEQDYPDIKAIEKFKDNSNKFLKEYFAKINQVDLDQYIDIPWSKYFTKVAGKPPASVTLRDTILQVIMHSTYHRAQVNKRLRELDIDPPLVDYIVWLWLGETKK